MDVTDQTDLFAQFQLFQRFLASKETIHPKSKAGISSESITELSNEASKDEFDEYSSDDSDDIYGT